MHFDSFQVRPLSRVRATSRQNESGPLLIDIGTKNSPASAPRAGAPAYAHADVISCASLQVRPLSLECRDTACCVALSSQTAMTLPAASPAIHWRSGLAIVSRAIGALQCSPLSTER